MLGLCRGGDVSYTKDIGQLLSAVSRDVWADKSICGLLYDIYPWHGYSSIAVQTRSCPESDPACWKYFDAARSDGELLDREFRAYSRKQDPVHECHV